MYLGITVHKNKQIMFIANVQPQYIQYIYIYI